MSIKKDTFDKNNIFLLQGHGMEAFDKDLPRYILGPNEYLATFNSPGDIGLVVDPGYNKAFFNTGKTIIIPTSKDKYLVKPSYLGISDELAHKKMPFDLKYVLFTDLKEKIVESSEDELRKYASKKIQNFLDDIYKEIKTPTKFLNFFKLTKEPAKAKDFREQISEVIEGNLTLKEKAVNVLKILKKYDRFEIFGESTVNLLNNILGTSHKLIYTKPIKAQHIDYWKLYHPRQNDEPLNYLNTAPNIIFAPGAYYVGAIFNIWLITHSLKTKDADIFINTMPAVIKYKDVFYYNLINKINVMTLRKSGILCTNQENPRFKKIDIENYDTAFDIIREGEISLYGEILDPFDGVNNGAITIFYPEYCMNQSLGEIISNKYKDPLAYDFISWYKAAYNESILSFDDLCLYAISKIGLQNNKSRLQKFNEFFKRELPNKIKQYTGISSIFLSDNVKTLVSKAKSVLSLLSFLYKSTIASGKSVYEKYQKEGEIFLELKKSLNKEQIQTLSLGLYLNEIFDVAMSLDTVYKFINTYGNVEGKPFMVLPVICRAVYGDIQLVDEKRKMTRPEQIHTRSKGNSKPKSKSKTRKNRLQ